MNKYQIPVWNLLSSLHKELSYTFTILHVLGIFCSEASNLEQIYS